MTNTEMPKAVPNKHFHVEASKLGQSVEFSYYGTTSGLIGTLSIDCWEGGETSFVPADKHISFTELSAVMDHARMQQGQYGRHQERKADVAFEVKS